MAMTDEITVVLMTTNAERDTKCSGNCLIDEVVVDGSWYQ